MDNKQLYNFFIAIKLGSSNPFNLILELKENKKEYKKSEFYKKTKMGIFKAYQLFIKAEVANRALSVLDNLSIDNIAEKLENVIDNMDTSKIEGLIKKITEGIDEDSIEELQKTLKESTDKLSKDI